MSQQLVVVRLQEGREVEVNVWNAAVRAAVNAGAEPALLDDLLEDMLLAGAPRKTPRHHA